jgi:hypothetical protein
MMDTNNIIYIALLALIIAGIYWVFGGKEGFYQYLGYPPFVGPGYFFNFPTREYPPPSFMGYDLRGPPGCPFFGRCGEAIRSGEVTVPDKRYFYDYWWPLPQFRYDKFYGANGRLHSTA